MLKIYGADLSSAANKVRFVANYLGLEYEYIQIKIRDDEHRKEDFLKLNPVGKIPVMDDDGFVVFESGAICKYLAQKHKSDLYPADLTQRAIVDQWIDFTAIHVNGAMGRVMFNRVFAPSAGVEKDERSLQDGLNFLNRFFPVIEARLAQSTYLAGDTFTLADITLVSALDPAGVAQVDLSSYPSITEFLSECRQKDFYTRCYKEYGDLLKRMPS